VRLAEERATRARISPAALFVKVSARIALAGTPRSRSRAIRWVMTRVLPEPAPARTTADPMMLHGSLLCGVQR
jgi:hypothetical protein